MEIAVRAQSEVVLPPETLLRAQQQTAQMKLLEKAKELQRSARDTPETVLFVPQKDSGLMSRDNPLLPIHDRLHAGKWSYISRLCRS